MTAIDFLVEKLKLESIDLSLWHQNLIDEANEMLKQQLDNAYDKGLNDALPSNNKFGSISIGKH
jgi:hypothetical protein